MAKKLKNTTITDITINGTVIAAGAYYTLQQFEEIGWRDDADIEVLIDSGDLLYSDDINGDVSDIVLAKKLLNANNAVSISNVPVNQSAPSDNELLEYDSASGEMKWINSNELGSGRNSVSLFFDAAPGYVINSGSFEVNAFKPVAGPDLYNNPTFVFGSVANTGNNDAIEVRLVVSATGQVLGTLSWSDETDETLKTIAVTPPNGVNILEIQTRKTQGGGGNLFSSGLEVIYGN